MKSSKKFSLKKPFLYIPLLLVIAVAIFLLLPSNYYVSRALIHLMPKIDQYTIFDNRNVAAGDPQPWDFAKDYTNKVIPHEFESDFSKYQTVAFVVVQHNKIIFEQYWKNYTPISLSNSFSMSKSIISLLVGCAESHNSLFSKTTEAYYGKDLWKLTLTEKMVEKPGVRFNYQSGVSQILAFLLQKATGKSVSQYASEKIWTPIQAEEDAVWSLDHKKGMEKAYCCFNSNARDFARLGQLILNKGRWNGKQVVDSNYIKEATTPATWLQYTPKSTHNESISVKPVPCTFYGYQFWIANYQGLKVPYFRGILGQYILVIPELDAVIVRLGKKRDKEYNLQQDYTKDLDIWLKAGIEVINSSTGTPEKD